MLVDANLLLFAVDEAAPGHDGAAAWLAAQLNGERRIGLPWESLTAFVRISTHPRASDHPLKPGDAWRFVEDWLAAPATWIPLPTDSHADVLGRLVRRYHLAGNLIPDAQLAALAIQHGLEVCSADTDFARFTEIHWRNPLARHVGERHDSVGRIGRDPGVSPMDPPAARPPLPRAAARSPRRPRD